MELFYSKEIFSGICTLDADESVHCVRVLRHRTGDEIDVVDGEGTLHHCSIISDSVKGVQAKVLESTQGWGSHPYTLHLAVCPTKNNDRYEWFVEKACELGVDSIYPIIGEHSQRRVFKTHRTEKIVISASKQSLKASFPKVYEQMSVIDFIKSFKAGVASGEVLGLIAYCFEDETVPRVSIREALASSEASEIVIMIGPEGDFSHQEAKSAIECGFKPVHLGSSRLRTETAAITAVEAVYFKYM